MSTYIDTVHPERHAPYLDIPDDVIDYLHYLDFVKQRSPRTVNGYYLDLRSFFRFMAVQWNLAAEDTEPSQIDLRSISTQQIASVRKRDIFNFLEFARAQSNGAKARARKLSALRGFFGYMHTQVNRIQDDPTANISLGTPKKALPAFYSRQSLSLFYSFDYACPARAFSSRRLILSTGSNSGLIDWS